MEAYEKKLVDKAFLDGIDLDLGERGRRPGDGPEDRPPRGRRRPRRPGRQGPRRPHRRRLGTLRRPLQRARIRRLGSRTGRWTWPCPTSPPAAARATSTQGTARGQNDYAATDSLGVCLFATDGFGKDGLRDLLSAITGVDWTEAEYLKAGERIYNLERALNCREGFAREDDALPARFFDDPLGTGPGKGAVLKRDEFETKLTEYYRDRGWDERTGRPTPQKLAELGIRL